MDDDKLRKESAEQELKGSGQKIKGKIQEGVAAEAALPSQR